MSPSSVQSTISTSESNVDRTRFNGGGSRQNANTVPPQSLRSARAESAIGPIKDQFHGLKSVHFVGKVDRSSGKHTTIAGLLSTVKLYIYTLFIVSCHQYTCLSLPILANGHYRNTDVTGIHTNWAAAR